MLDGGHQIGVVTGPVELTVDPWLHEVERATGGRCHHRHPAGHGLLDGLAERLVLTGVDEQVERGHGPPQIVAGQLPGEMGIGHGGLEVGPLGPVSDDDQSEARVPGQCAQALHPLLGGQATDEADGQATIQLPVPTQGTRSLARIELGQVDAPSPHLDRGEAAVGQFPGHGRRRRQREIGPVVDATEPAPDRLGRRPEPPVVGDEAGEVGLEHRHRRDAEAPADRGDPSAEQGRRGQVDDVRSEGAEGPLDLGR